MVYKIIGVDKHRLNRCEQHFYPYKILTGVKHDIQSNLYDITITTAATLHIHNGTIGINFHGFNFDFFKADYVSLQIY